MNKETAKQDNVIKEYHKIMDRIMEKLKEKELVLNIKKGQKAEDLAEKYYTKKGYIVYRSRVKAGYRIIGVKYYWKEYEDLLTEEDKKIVYHLHNILGEKEFRELAYLTKDKNGCPDLMLVKSKKIRFVEVKTNNEEIKSATLEFSIRNKKYPLSILRVKHK
jgi:Holliday junction resolvase-like predicted endonuclease